MVMPRSVKLRILVLDPPAAGPAQSRNALSIIQHTRLSIIYEHTRITFRSPALHKEQVTYTP